MYTAAVAVTPVDVHVRVHGAAGAPTGRGDMKRRTWGAAGPWAPSGGCGPATAAASALTSGARSDRPDAAGGTQTQLILRSKLHAVHACAIGFDAKRRHQGAITRGVHPQRKKSGGVSWSSYTAMVFSSGLENTSTVECPQSPPVGLIYGDLGGFLPPDELRGTP